MNISQRLRTCAKHTGLDAVIELLNEAADEIDRRDTIAQATQPAEVTDEQIIAIKKATKAADPTQQWGDTLAFARAILALRPVQVPMTDESLWTAVIEHLGPEALSGGRMSILDAFHLGITVAEAHHGITAQAKKETP